MYLRKIRPAAPIFPSLVFPGRRFGVLTFTQYFDRAGYIGSHMVYELADAGERVVVLDNLDRKSVV